jgi:hypothetical protein
MKTKQRKSVAQRVADYVNKHPTNISAATLVAAYPKIPKPQLATALWKLHKSGVISRVSEGVYELLSGADAPMPKKKAKARQNSKEAELIARLGAASEEIMQWNTDYKSLKRELEAVKMERDDYKEELNEHDDQDAIIRYLEQKLWVAFNHIARLEASIKK